MLEGSSCTVSFLSFGSFLENKVRGMGRGRKAHGSSLSMTETEIKVWRLGVPGTTVLPYISMAPFSEKTKHSMNLAIDFPFTAPQDTKQGHHYGLYSLQEELKNSLTAFLLQGNVPWEISSNLQIQIYSDAPSKQTDWND